MRVFGRTVARATGVLGVLVACVWLDSAPVSAESAAAAEIAAAARSAPNGSHLDRIEQVGDTEFDAYVYSAAMDRVVLVRVLRPAGGVESRPTLYLLNGAGGGEDRGENWQGRTDAVDFFAGKDVNVVIPMGGRASYYTDWQRDDPVLGRLKWQTFLTEELPPVVDSAFQTNGVNAIAGISMAGSAVLALAESKPGFYRAVASYSGCARTSDPVGQIYVRLVVEIRAGGNVTNMWGPLNSPTWAANDPYVNAEKLRGTALFISAGSGLPGPHDNFSRTDLDDNVIALGQQIVLGGAIEAVANECTVQLRDRLDALGIPATYSFRPVGTHSWGYWQDDLHASWPVLAAGLGIS